MRRLCTLAVLVLLAACAPTRQERLAALTQFVGQPEAAVISQFGLPTRAYETGGIRFLAYDEKRVGLAPGYVGYGGWGPVGAPYGWYGYGFVGAPPVVERICETLFEVAGGLVRKASLHGHGCGL